MPKTAGAAARGATAANELWGTLRARPLILLVGALIFAIGTTVGVVVVWHVALTQKASQRDAANAAAAAASAALRLQLMALLQPVSGTVSYVTAGVGMNYTTLANLFPAAAQGLLNQINPPNPDVTLMLAPQGVVSDIHPKTSITRASLGTDLLGPGLVNLTIGVMRAGLLSIQGPFLAADGAISLSAVSPIFIAGVTAGETFSEPVAMSPACPPSLCYQPATGTKFWGMVLAVTPFNAMLGLQGGPIQLLTSLGYNYILLQPAASLPATPGYGGRTVLARSAGAVADPESATLDLSSNAIAFSEWTLQVSPASGWGFAWVTPIYVVVVIISIFLALVVSMLIVSRVQHEMLLYSLVPKHLVNELRRHSTYVDYKADDAFELNTPAEVMLELLSNCLQGHIPDPATVVQLRATLLSLQDIYRPNDLGEQLRAADLDDEVANALFGLIGKGPNQARDLGMVMRNESLLSIHASGSANLDSVVPCGTAEDLQVVLTSMLKGQLDNGHVGGGNRRASTIWQTQPGMRDSTEPQSNSVSHSGVPGGDSGIFSAETLQLNDNQSAQGGTTSGNGGQQQPENGIKAKVRRLSNILQFRNNNSGTGTLFASDSQQGGNECTGLSPAANTAPVEITQGVFDELNHILEKAYTSWTFDAFALCDASCGRPLSVLGYALIHRAGLMDALKLKPIKVARFLQAVEVSYMDNPYHCKIHAADVLQTFHVVLTKGGFMTNYVDPIHHLACIMAASSHDVEHEGVTNDFLVSTENMLALRYNDRSPMENHHLAAMYSLLKHPANNFVGHLSKEMRDVLRKVTIELVLGTDMKQHLTITSQFKSVHKATIEEAESSSAAKPMITKNKSTSGAKSAKIVSFKVAPAPSMVIPKDVSALQPPTPLDETERMLTLQMALKVADLGHLAEELEVHRRWVKVLEEEFFKQGDRERERGMAISPLFDRNKPGVTKSQVGFFDFVALPLFRMFTLVFPTTQPMLECLEENYSYWKDITEGGPVVVIDRGNCNAKPSQLLRSSTPVNKVAPVMLEEGRGSDNSTKLITRGSDNNKVMEF